MALRGITNTNVYVLFLSLLGAFFTIEKADCQLLGGLTSILGSNPLSIMSLTGNPVKPTENAPQRAFVPSASSSNKNFVDDFKSSVDAFGLPQSTAFQSFLDQINDVATGTGFMDFTSGGPKALPRSSGSGDNKKPLGAVNMPGLDIGNVGDMLNTNNLANMLNSNNLLGAATNNMMGTMNQSLMNAGNLADTASKVLNNLNAPGANGNPTGAGGNGAPANTLGSIANGAAGALQGNPMNTLNIANLLGGIRRLRTATIG